MDANYRFKRNPVTGAAAVHFKCERCSSPVVFDLPDAGKTEPCPACGVALVVPGLREKQAADEEARAKADEERRQREALERARQAAEKERVAAQEARTKAAEQAMAKPGPSIAAPPANQPTGREKRVADMTGRELRRVIAGGVVLGVLALIGMMATLYLLWGFLSGLNRVLNRMLIDG
jgi:uncharacterized Zn finger protein (UPF0148 family)